MPNHKRRDYNYSDVLPTAVRKDGFRLIGTNTDYRLYNCNRLLEVLLKSISVKLVVGFCRKHSYYLNKIVTGYYKRENTMSVSEMNKHLREIDEKEGKLRWDSESD